jgi:hypothetical protein
VIQAPPIAPQESLEALSSAAANFAAIANDLLAGYEALEQRAQRIERELAVSNAALAVRLAEVDGLNADLAALLSVPLRRLWAWPGRGYAKRPRPTPPGA